MTKSMPSKNLVLYADDDPDDIAFVQDAFKTYVHSIELKTFKDGVELLSFIENLKPFEPLPCLIILDINMPHRNGKQVLSDLRNIEGFEAVPRCAFFNFDLALGKKHLPKVSERSF